MLKTKPKIKGVSVQSRKEGRVGYAVYCVVYYADGSQKTFRHRWLTGIMKESYANAYTRAVAKEPGTPFSDNWQPL
jgi:hypothetical protein